MDEENESWQDTCEKLLSKEPVGLDDMTELDDVNDHSIAENLRIRLMDEQIYTCIGRVLIAVNPFKKLNIYDQRFIRAYHDYSQGKYVTKSTSKGGEDALKCSTAPLLNLGQNEQLNSAQEEVGKELPPHIYALTDNMYENMMIEKESQCVIISGESGAGKTISAKYIMSYLSEIASGGTKKIEEIKNIIVQSNPLLEAFGNAKTLRNNNSSRFGKFVEILFNMAGQPDGGKISNFLLEKSRVVTQNPGERNYHVFYQLLRGCTEEEKENLGLVQTSPEAYYYLNRTGGAYDLPDADDAEEFQLTMNAMDVVGMSEEMKTNVLEIITAILHLGNIQFVEDNNVADVENRLDMITPSKLLGVNSDELREKLVSRLMEARWGGKVDIMMMTLNSEQAMVCRDALAKALFAQLFDFLVTIINSAMWKEKTELCIGVLDIYGFEIFETNGFEQFCINFVNEKLQQIFVELTLKNEQEEYLEEGIVWTPVKFFNNKLVCDLIENKTPPGIMSILDDVCFTVHASEGSDRTLMEKLKAVVGSESLYSRYFRGQSTHFEIHHYAGKVHYEAKHFCERNKDVLFEDVIQLMQSSTNEFIRSLFSDMPTTTGRRGRSSTGSSKIKAQCQTLIDRIMACTPHYVRCLKPSETKEPLDWHDQRILPQISYLGLRENIDVRRAGFAFRRIFDKIIERYDIILSREVAERVCGDRRNMCEAIMETARLSTETWKIGRTKVFMKESDMITKLEQARSDALFQYAVKLQSLVRGFLARRYCKKLRERIRASKIIQRTLRRYVENKRLNYRLLVKQYLKGVIADLEAEAESLETPEWPEIPEWPALTFTHNETIDHAGGYYSNKNLQQITGNHSVFFTCGGKLFSNNLKMDKHLVVLSLYHFYIVHKCSSGQFELKYKLDYGEVQRLFVSVLDTDFLVLKLQTYDLILESPHKNSLIAFFLAISSTVKERPPLEKSDEVFVNAESGKEICLKFLKEGRSRYKEPCLSKNGRELTVIIPDMEEVIEGFPSVEEVEEVVDLAEDTNETTLDDRGSLPRYEQTQVVQEGETTFSFHMEFGKSGGKVSCKGFEIHVPESSAPKQTVKLDIFSQLPSPSYSESGEMMLSPFIAVTEMLEEETELRLRIPFLPKVSGDTETMAKWIRFYGFLSDGVSPVWRDIRNADDLDTFMVEIRDDHAKLYTQENITFCIFGSRDEEQEEYDYGFGLETYGEYGDYAYGYDDSNHSEHLTGESDDPYSKDTFCTAREMVDKALHTTPTPPPSFGAPPPLPTSTRPPLPFPSPFSNVPLAEESESKKRSSKSRKKKKSKKRENSSELK